MTSPTPDAPPKKTTEKTNEGGKNDAIELLKADHREVEKLFSQFEENKGRRHRKKLIGKIAAALTAHTMIEEDIFYPACRAKGVEHDDLDEAQVEHDTVKLLVADLIKSDQGHDYYDAKVTVLREYVKHHVGEEENPSDGIFARAKSAGLDMAELGRKLQKRKDELMSDEQSLIARPPQIRSLNLSQLNQEYGDMSRYPTDRYRDEESRNGGYRSAGKDYRGVDYDDESRGSSISRGSRGEFYRGDYDEDFGPNRGTYGQSDYDRSAEGYRDDDRGSAYRGGENARGGYENPGTRRIEQSGSGGRYRLDYDQDDDYRSQSGTGRHLGPSGEGRYLGQSGEGRYLGQGGEGRHLNHPGEGRHLDHPGEGRYLGQGSEDREYYQGTRYGSSYDGGRHQNQGEDGNHDRGERYYSGQGHGTTRGGEFGGQSAYGSGSDYEDGGYEGRGASLERGRPGYGTGDYRRRNNGGSGQSQYGRNRFEGSGSGYRGNR